MRVSTMLIGGGLLLIVIPIPVLPPFVGATIGIVLLAIGVFLRVLGV